MKKRLLFTFLLSGLLLTSCDKINSLFPGLNSSTSGSTSMDSSTFPSTSEYPNSSSSSSSSSSTSIDSSSSSSIDSSSSIESSSSSSFDSSSSEKVNISSIRFALEEQILPKDKRSNVTVNVEPKNSNYKLRFYSQDENIAVFIGNSYHPGLYGVEKGETTIYVEDIYTGLTASCRVKVDTLIPESVIIPGSDELYVGDTMNVIADAAPFGASDKATITIVEGSENLSISNIPNSEDLFVKALKPGTFRVHALLKDKDALGNNLETTRTFVIKERPLNMTTFDLGEDRSLRVLADGVKYSNAPFISDNRKEQIVLENYHDVYDRAFDKNGKSVLKVGAAFSTGSFEFNVPNDVKQVEFYVAAYKYHNARISINGVETDIMTISDEGNYTRIVVDTNANKKVIFKTIGVPDDEIPSDPVKPLALDSSLDSSVDSSIDSSTSGDSSLVPPTPVVRLSYRVLIDRINFIR